MDYQQLQTTIESMSDSDLIECLTIDNLENVVIIFNYQNPIDVIKSLYYEFYYRF